MKIFIRQIRQTCINKKREKEICIKNADKIDKELHQNVIKTKYTIKKSHYKPSGRLTSVHEFPWGNWENLEWSFQVGPKLTPNLSVCQQQRSNRVIVTENVRDQIMLFNSCCVFLVTNNGPLFDKFCWHLEMRKGQILYKCALFLLP
jgi:hypothetical protein